MAITGSAAGAWAASNATTQTVTLPAHAAGDMLILRAATKPYNGTITCDTAGWQPVGNQFNNGTTANGNGTGSLCARAFWKIATSGAETNPVVTWGTTSAPGGAVAICYSKAAGETWETPVGAGGGDSTPRTSQTATIGSHISVTAGDVIDFFDYICDNVALTVPVITQTGVTYSATTEYPATALSSGTSNDMGADGGYRTASSGTSSAAAVVTWTVGTSAEEGGAWQTRLRVHTTDPTDTAVGEVSLASATDPAVHTDHFIKVRAKYSGTLTLAPTVPTMKVALYEGANNRSGDLETDALTTSLADYILPISEANAANITDYSNLGIRFWGHSTDGALTFEVDTLTLVIPEAGGAPAADEPMPYIGGGYYA